MTWTITIRTGKEAKEFVVIENIVTRSSKFLQAAMNRDWKEAKEKRVLLPEIETSIFEGYLQWLYTSDLTFTESVSVELVKFFILGDFLIDASFRHAVIDSMINRHQEDEALPRAQAVKLAWQQTTPVSVLRAVILKLYASCDLLKAIQSLRESQTYPREFILDLLDLMAGSHGLVKERPLMGHHERLKKRFNDQILESDTE